MGNQNHSVARKRLSTLAITTTLAAVGVGVVGTGAANAATGTPQTHSADTGTTAVATAAAVKVTAGTGSTSLTATADLTGTMVDKGAAAGATVTIDWNNGKGPQAVLLDPATGLPVKSTLTNVYTAPGTYNVVVAVDDGQGAKTSKQTATTPVTVTDATLVAKVTPNTTVKKNTAVTLSLTGSSVDGLVAGSAFTTVNWGDGSKVATLLGDPAKIKADDPALVHSFAADNTYNVVVTLDDGLGTKDSQHTQTIKVTVSETTGVVVDRASGDDRYGTGLVISQHEWASTGVSTDTRQQAKSVVLATGKDFADALVGVPLAKKEAGPLLLTDGSAAKTNPQVLDEIKRILPTKGTTVYILGGEKALSTGIEKEIQGLGYTTKRLAGADRFGTALAIATDQSAMADPAHIIVARGDEGENGNGFADALAAGPYAANVFGGGNSAIVLTNDKAFDPTTKAYVTSKLKAGQKNVAAIGFQAVAAMTTIKGSDGTYAWAAGATRYETAEAVAKAYETSAKNTAPIGVATGLQFPDALTGGAYMATIDGPLLLTDPAALSPATKDEISGVAATVPAVTIFGGEKAIAPAVANAIAALVKATTIGKF